jgi:hypothetical protein
MFIVAGPDIFVVFTQHTEYLEKYIQFQQRLLGQQIVKVAQIESFSQE